MEKPWHGPATLAILGVVTLLSSFYGNYLQYQQVELAKLAQHASPLPTSPDAIPAGGDMSHVALYVSFIPTVVSVLFLAYLFYKVRNKGLSEGTSTRTLIPTESYRETELARIQRENIDKLNAELEPYRRHAAEDLKRKEVPSDAPTLLIHYEKDPKGIYELLTFTNDSTNAMVGIAIGHLRLREEKELSTFDKVPAIPGKSSYKAVLTFEESAKSLTSLQSFIREKTGKDAVRVVSVKFSDSKGTNYIQDFIVDSQAYGGLIWTAGVVRLDQGDEAAGR